MPLKSALIGTGFSPSLAAARFGTSVADAFATGPTGTSPVGTRPITTGSAAASAAFRPDLVTLIPGNSFDLGAGTGTGTGTGMGTGAGSGTGATRPPITRADLALEPGFSLYPGLFLPQPEAATATSLAERSISILDETAPAEVKAAIAAIKARIQNKRITGVGQLFFLLERRTRIGEIYARRAAQWAEEDREDFRTEFQIRAEQTAVMDAIASIAVLNDPALDGEIKAEHLAPGVTEDALENRRVVWQYPPPGTPMEAPFTVLLAVEHVDVAAAQGAVEAVTGRLSTFDGMRLPKSTIQRLG